MLLSKDYTIYSTLRLGNKEKGAKTHYKKKKEAKLCDMDKIRIKKNVDICF
jgi:hypothetical protein